MNYWAGSADALILPGGTAPGDVATLMSAIQREFVPAAGMPRPSRVIVPVDPGADIERVRTILAERVVDPISPAVAVILQTSGSTTGVGHLVGLSRLSLTAGAHATAGALSGYGTWVLCLPTHHVAGFQILVRSVVADRVPIVVDTTRGFRVEAMARAVRRAVKKPGPAYSSIVPAQLQMIMQAAAEDIDALCELDAILVGGQATDPELLERARDRGLKLVTTYGMTETGGGCVYDGVPLRGVKVATIDQRVWISGTTIMDGYVDDPHSGALVTAAGRRWLRTSDQGRMVGPKLQVVGRIDSVINTGGVKVQPSIVEDSLRTLSAIEDVCVVGLPHPKWGQVVTAVFVPSPNADPNVLAAMRRRRGLLPADAGPQAVVPPSEALKQAVAEMAASIRGDDQPAESATTVFAQLAPGPRQVEGDADIALRMRAHVAAELGRAQAPRIVCMVDELPRLGIGKIDRRRVAQIAQAEVTAGHAWIR